MANNESFYDILRKGLQQLPAYLPEEEEEEKKQQHSLTRDGLLFAQRLLFVSHNNHTRQFGGGLLLG